MSDFKMSIILAVLGSIIFSLLFILLAFVLPTADENKNDMQTHYKTPSK
jgi:ABC-type antimicrobial peptide transport system permease subunit